MDPHYIYSPNVSNIRQPAAELQKINKSFRPILGIIFLASSQLCGPNKTKFGEEIDIYWSSQICFSFLMFARLLNQSASKATGCRKSKPNFALYTLITIRGGWAKCLSFGLDPNV